MKRKRLLIIAGIVVLILSIPMTLMLLENNVDWELADFILAGIVLFGVGMTIDYISRKLANHKYKTLIIISIIILLLLLWAELGVGIFGSPIAGD